jgi:hypothetical protein
MPLTFPVSVKQNLKRRLPPMHHRPQTPLPGGEEQMPFQLPTRRQIRLPELGPELDALEKLPIQPNGLSPSVIPMNLTGSIRTLRSDPLEICTSSISILSPSSSRGMIRDRSQGPLACTQTSNPFLSTRISAAAADPATVVKAGTKSIMVVKMKRSSGCWAFPLRHAG